MPQESNERRADDREAHERFFDELDDLDARLRKMEVKCEALDMVYQDHIRWSRELANDVRAIHDKLATNGEKLVTLITQNESHREKMESEIKRLWGFPIKVMTVFGLAAATAGAIYGASKLIVKVVGP